MSKLTHLLVACPSPPVAFGTVSKIDLSGIAIGPDEAAALKEALSTEVAAAMVKKVLLRKCGLVEATAKTIAEGLRDHTSLHSLMLGANFGLNDAGVIALVSENPTLQKLSVRYCDVTDVFIKVICSSCMELEELDVRVSHLERSWLQPQLQKST